MSAGKDDVERASLAFVVGNTALASGQEATLMLTISGVWVATKGYTDGLQADGFQPLGELVQDFIANNGRVWVCNACANPRQISADDLIEGAQMIGRHRIRLGGCSVWFAGGWFPQKNYSGKWEGGVGGRYRGTYSIVCSRSPDMGV